MTPLRKVRVWWGRESGLEEEEGGKVGGGGGGGGGRREVGQGAEVEIGSM